MEINTAPDLKKIRLADIDEAAYNPRAISTEAMKGLRESISAYGMIEVPVLNVAGGKKVLISGHQRVKAMKAEGMTFADCIVVEFDPAEEMMANVTMNNPSIQGTFDAKVAVPVLEAVIPDLPTPSFAGFDKLSEDLHAQAARLEANAKTKQAGDATPEPEEEPDSEVGTVYYLGEHALYCGSCFDALGLWFTEEGATCCITDPPYNVAYEGAAGKIENDDMDAESWHEFIGQVAQTIVDATNGPCYVFMSSSELPSLVSAWKQAAGVVDRIMWWVKDRFTLGRSDYHQQHEPFLYGCKAGTVVEKPRNARGSVIQHPKPKSNPLHPTMKPVELIRMLMEDCSDVGDTVFEPFAGSGTTLVVAEELKRVCFACELDPKFCDVIRKRWAVMVHGEDCDWRALTGPT